MTLSIFRDDPGLAGIYIAATLSGTLSTVSSGINSLATCFVTDLLIPNEEKIFGATKKEKFYTRITKIISGQLLQSFFLKFGQKLPERQSISHFIFFILTVSQI